ncbi:MAG: biotin transporter BioY [Coriobacteriia bacterium]
MSNQGLQPTVADHPTQASRGSLRHARTAHVTVAALITALLAAAAWISIPIGTVPVTLQVFVVALAILLLRPETAGAALGAYLVLGTVGVPVFSGGLGGPGVLAGPTGGYLIGFLLAAVAGSAARLALERRLPRGLADGSALAIGIAVIYLVGWGWLRAVTGLGGGAAFAAGVAPFLAADAVKAFVALGMARAVRRSGVI